MPKYKDDQFDTIKEDVERIRVRPHMYISYTGSKGAEHLFHELGCNAIDEAVNPLSPLTKIHIDLDMNKNQVIIMDDGRGIPFDKVEEICTYLQSGSNLHKETNQKGTVTAGENGVGLTAVNALAEKLVFMIYRVGKRGTFTFDDGKLVNTEFTSCDNNTHGTTVIFVPSEKYLGKCKFDPSSIRDWVDEISYMIPNDTTMTLTIVKKGKEVGITETFKHKNGIVDMLDVIAEDQIIKPIHVISELNPGESIEVAFSFSESDTSDFTNVRSYANWIRTVDHGEHVDAVKTAWCRVVSKLALNYMTDNEKKKYPIVYEDCRVGLIATIVLKCYYPYFTGQTKQKVGNSDLFKPICTAVSGELLEYFRNNENIAKKIAGMVKRNAKARLEINKIRKSDYNRVSGLEAAVLKGYTKAISNSYRELYITEGDSAEGGVSNTCDHMYQAIFKMKGNPKNVYGLTMPAVLENAELKVLTKIIGGGIGDSFDLKKCQFDRILIHFDSDIDGYNMCSLLSVYFLWCMPKLVEAGRLYRVRAPLYIIDDKTNPYVISKIQYYEIFADIVSKNVELRTMTDSKVSKNKLRWLVTENRDYLSELVTLQKYFYTNPEIIEFALLYFGDKNFAKKLKERFPSLSYDPETFTISGSYNMAYQYLVIGNNFFDKCKRLYSLIHDVNHGEIYFIVQDKETSPTLVSLGTFMNMTKKYLPKIRRRIKGLGELPLKILWETTLDPTKRELIRLTCADLEKELAIARMLHGPDPETRKEFMKGYIFNPDDIDT